MHDHNLDDLIINEDVSKSNDKTKGILTIVALLIVVLIVAIVLTKIILKEPKVDTIVESNNTQMIDPELTLTEKKNNKKIVNEKHNDSVISINEDSSYNNDTEDIGNENKIDKPIVEKKEKIVTKKVEHTKIVQQKPKVDKVVIDDKFEQVKAKSKPKPVVHHNRAKKVSNEKYYIQVGSFSQQPSGKFLGVIKNSGFNYTVLSLPNGMKKLLIGPYPSRQAVDKALPKVRDRINKGAFVYKVK
jgi:DedD protein